MKNACFYLSICVFSALLLSGCGTDAPLAPSETRVVMPAEPAAPVGLTSEQRFGAPAPAAHPAPRAQQAFDWDAPPKWRDAGGRGMRLANFRVGPAGEAQCYLSMLSGAGGGVEMNVNRWRLQMGLPEMTFEKIAELPKMPMLDGQAVFLEIDGSYGGIGDAVHPTAGAGGDNYALIGAILMRESHALFLKMVGPAEIVADERDNFMAFAASLRDAAEGQCCPSEPHTGPTPSHICPSE